MVTISNKLIVLGIAAMMVGVSVAIYFVMKDDNGADESRYVDSYPDSRLWILGNANMDDHIDENDIEYLQGIIDGDQKYVLNDLCDANNDGAIDETDIEYVRGLISGEPMEVWFIDVDMKVTSIDYPVEDVIPIYVDIAEIIVVLGRTDSIIAADDLIVDEISRPQYAFGVPTVGNRFTPSVEAILEVSKGKNVTVFAGTSVHYDAGLEKKLEGSGIQVMRLPSFELGLTGAGVCTAGFLMNSVEKADEYLEWHDRILETITTRVSNIPEEDRVTTIITVRENTRGVTSGYYENSIISGGNNLAYEFSSDGFSGLWTAESVYEHDPDIFIHGVASTYIGTEETLNEYVDSLKETMPYYEGEIKVFGYEVANGPLYVISLIIYANWFYPDLFSDLDPIAEFQYYTDNFTDRDLDASQMSIFTP